MGFRGIDPPPAPGIGAGRASVRRGDRVYLSEIRNPSGCCSAIQNGGVLGASQAEGTKASNSNGKPMNLRPVPLCLAATRRGVVADTPSLFSTDSGSF